MAKKEPTKDTPAAKRRASRVAKALAAAYPDAECALHFRNPFELLVATILSAQCTDKMVNQVTPALFERYPDADSMAQAEPEELESLIHSTGFYKAKARHLLGMAKALVDEHGGEVPHEVVPLTKLPGVGRKTANVVLGTAFGIASGVVVDTHVKRLAYRLGLTEEADPERVERDLAAALPRREWIQFSHRLILHGRRTCSAARPRCGACELSGLCPRRGVAETRTA